MFGKKKHLTGSVGSAQYRDGNGQLDGSASTFGDTTTFATRQVGLPALRGSSGNRSLGN